MQVRIYADSQKELWDSFVRKSKNGTFLFLRDYMDYHRDRFVDHSLLVSDDKGHLVALLPANKQEEMIASHAGLTYGGFITDESMRVPLMLEVFECCFAYLKVQSFTWCIYKSIPYIYHRIPAEEDRYALFLCQARFQRRGVLTVVNRYDRPLFQSRRIRGAKKAERYGLCARASDDLEAFWEILKVVLQDIHYTQPVHTLPEIELLHSRFPENIRLFACYDGDEMVAGVVVYESERVAHVQYIASNYEGRAKGALDYLFAFLLNEVYGTKPFFDFGTSDEENGLYLNQGLIDQKEGFGARAVMHDHYEIDLTRWESGRLTHAMKPWSNGLQATARRSE